MSMDGEAGNSHARLEIGTTLERAREMRGLSLQQVEEATKIRTRYLRDLENENFDVLPAVYMVGSLKTYAAHLGLDGEALARELKRRQATQQAQLEQAREEHPADETRGFLAFLSRLVGIGETVEDEAGTVPDAAHGPRLYVSLVVLLVFILVTALASSFRGEDRATISQMREPKSSQIPARADLVGNMEDGEPASGYGKLVNQPDKQVDILSRDARNDDEVRAERSGQVSHAPRKAQVLSSPATAFASVSANASASASPASTGAVSSTAGSASATATPAPVSDGPKPAAKQEPAGGGGEVATAPPDIPARTSGGVVLHRTQGSNVNTSHPDKTQAGPVDATRFGDGIPDEANNALNSAW